MGEAVGFVKRGDDASELCVSRSVSAVAPFTEQRCDGGRRNWDALDPTLESVMGEIRGRNGFGEMEEGRPAWKDPQQDTDLTLWSEKMFHAQPLFASLLS